MFKPSRLWIVGPACVALITAIGISAAGYTTAAFVIGAVALIAVAVSGMIVNRTRRHSFEHRYGSLEQFRDGIDRSGLRALRDSDGEAAAIRALRRDHPELSLSQSAEVVRGL
ncbi:hypothetical protein [Nocardia sp. NPDC003345]